VALDAASMIAFDWDIRLNQVRRFDPSEPSLPTRPPRPLCPQEGRRKKRTF